MATSSEPLVCLRCLEYHHFVVSMKDLIAQGKLHVNTVALIVEHMREQNESTTLIESVVDLSGDYFNRFN